MSEAPKQSVLSPAGAATRRKTAVRQDGVHLAPDAALLIRSDGTIAELNHYAEELFGYARAELLGQSLSVLIPERFRKAHTSHFTAYHHDARARAMGSGMDLWGLRKDGTEFPVDIALTPRSLPEGLHVVCSIRDLSVRLSHAVEEELRFQTLATDISARFTGPVLDDLDKEITGAIQQIVEFLGADRGSFSEFSADDSILTVTHTYNASGIPPVPRTVMNDRLPWLTAELLRGHAVRVRRMPEDLPPEAVREREYFKAEGMKAGVAIPLKSGERFAFAIAVSSFRSEHEWPPGLIVRLQLLGEIFINALTRRRLRDALEEQLAFEKLVVDVSARFAGLATQNIDAEITLGLREVAEFLGVDRCGFGECRRDEGSMVSTHFYAAPGIPPPPEVVRNEFPWWVARLWRGEMHRHARLPDDLPSEAGREREYVLAVGMKAHLSMPINIGDSATYFFTAESFSAAREWPDAFVQRLRLLGEIFANALMRKRSVQALQELSGRLIRAQEDERARVARELHDDLSQRLALLAIELEQAGQQVAKSTPVEAAALQGLWLQTREIGTDLHRISRQLHPSQLEALGLVSALRGYCAEFSKQKRLRIEFTHDGVSRELPNNVTLCLYRIVQESLQNAIQHGRARRIDISLEGGPDAVQLTVVDDGVGFDVVAQASGPGLGLVSMRERARLVDGEFAVRSEPNQGTRIDVRVPLDGRRP